MFRPRSRHVHARLASATVAVLASALLTSSALAEKVDMSKESLGKVATHVVRGTVAAIYQRTETADKWRYTRYVAEVRVDAVEKGEDIAAGDLVYVRYWRRSWLGRSNPPPSTGGHRGLPETGQTLRIYLARNAYDGFTKDNTDGGFNVIGANGFEKLEPAAAR